MQKKHKGKKRILICLFLLLGVSIQACATKENFTNSQELERAEKDSFSTTFSALDDGTSAVRLETGEKVNIWRFLLSEQTELPVLRIGFSCQFFSDEAGWLASQENLNRYLKENGEYQVETIVVQALDKEYCQEAVSQCLAEDLDIWVCNGIDSEAIDLSYFIDLGKEPYRQELDSYFALYPEKYWEYITLQMGGIYSLSHSFSAYGSRCLSIWVNEEWQEAGIDWDPEEGIGNTWGEWVSLFEEWQKEYGEKVSVLDIYSAREGKNIFLPYLAPETECQVVAPGLGIELKTGEAVKILEMPVIQERIAQYQHFMDQGMVVQEQTEYAIVKDIGRNGVWAGAASSSPSIANGEYWVYYVDSELYYPITMEYGNSFAGVPKTGEPNIELIMQFYQQIAKDETCRNYLQAEKPFLQDIFALGYLEDGEGGVYQADGSRVSAIQDALHNYKEAAFSPATGFRFDTHSVEEEIRAIERVVQGSQAQRSIQFGWNNATFSEDLETLQEEMEQAGLNVVYEELKQQLEHWKRFN